MSTGFFWLTVYVVCCTLIFMSNTENSAVIVEHPFTHLAAPPYKFCGMTEKLHCVPGCAPKPGGSCDYCATGIRFCFWLEGADGKRFKVGSSCISKAAKAAKHITALQKLARDAKRQLRRRRERTRIEEAYTVMGIPEVCVALDAQPHPLKWRAEQGETLLDSLEWMFRNAGNAGKLRAAKTIMAAAEAVAS
jgi:hypothetical protein